MFFLEFIFVFFMTLLFVSLLTRGTNRRNSGGDGIVAIFIILLIATWAGGLWVTPIGRPVLGVYWLSYLIVGFFVMMFLSVIFSFSDRYYRRTYKGKDAEEEALGLGIFFWFFLVIALGAIIISYAS